MQAAVSTYLDVVRLSAAIVVLIYHACGSGITGGFLWPVGRYGQTAVMVFFVLSGYVIAHVTQIRSDDL